MRMGLTSIYVDDQDQAEQFYTKVLGFQVKTTAPYGPDERWLSLISPEEPDGMELVLHLADEPVRAFQQASRAAGRCCRCAPTTAPPRPSGSRPRGWCPSRSRTGGSTAASTRCSTTAAATCSTSTKTDRGAPWCSPAADSTAAPPRPGSARWTGRSVAPSRFAAHLRNRAQRVPSALRPGPAGGGTAHRIHRHRARRFTRANAPDGDADADLKGLPSGDESRDRAAMKPSSSRRKS
jgi:hypothetical protein